MTVNILITGGAGYIGSILCQKLVQNNENHVTVYDNFSFGVDPILHLIDRDNFNVVEGDIRAERIKNLIVKADVVIHLAALVGYPACESNPSNAVSTNVDGTQNVLKYLSPSQMFLYASTGSVYGKGKDFCSEDATVHPQSLYAITKYEGEQKAMQRENSIALRFATVFGISPRMRMDLLVNDLLFQALRNKAVALYEKGARRTFLHSQDAAESYLLAMDRFEHMKGEIYNIGNPKLNLTKHELLVKIQKYVDFCIVEENFDTDLDARDYIVDFSKIENQGYSPKVDIDDGIKELLKLYSLPGFYRYMRNA